MNFNEWVAKFFPTSKKEDPELLKAYNELYRPPCAVYAISADPPTWGHADIMMRAANKFSHLHWVFANNTSKKAMFSSQDKLNMMKIYVDHYKLTNVIIDSVEGSVARFASKVQADYLIRGLRSSSDYQMEYELSVGNRGIDKNLETICMFTKPHYATISSSIVRELAVLNEPITQYVHPKVEEMVATIVQSRR